MSLEGSLESVTIASNKAGIDLFELLGTDGCKLDCAYWQTWLDLNNINKNRRKVRQEKRELKKASSPLAKRWEQGERGCFSFDDLSESAAGGCGACKFFGRLLERVVVEFDDLTRDNVLFRWIGYHFNLQILDVKDSRTPSAIANMSSAHLLSGDTSNVASLQAARHWITQCDRSHKDCRVGETPKLPKRVLDLAEIAEGGKRGIRLIEDQDTVASWACLSHCWGKDPMPVRTTKETHRRFLEFIDLASLPKTFYDAIIISRGLGLRYLWIDSLCIVQDSLEDWQIQSSKMADIYRNGYVTIAAVSSPDFRHGCFPQSPCRDICVELELTDTIRTSVAARRRSSDSYEQQFPLFTRAWVYQERMLSRRVLLCDHRELQFECLTDFACQCGNRLMPPHVHTANQRTMLAKRKYSEKPDFHTYVRNWHNALTAYSALRLTHGSDKLPALSACASDSSAGRGRYLAGAWEQSLVEDLLWIVVPPEQTPNSRRGRPVWRAPSWSWVSVDTETGVRFECKNRNLQRPTTEPSVKKFRDRIIEVECKLKPPGLNKYGELASGYIRLRTPLVPASLRNLCHICLMGTRRGKRYVLETNRIQEHQNNHARQELCILENQTRLQVPPGVGVNLNPDFLYEDRTFDSSRNNAKGYRCGQVPIWLMYICDMATTSTQQPAGPRTMYFMVLKHLPLDLINFDEECYERVGMMRMVFSDPKALEIWQSGKLAQLSTEEKVITLE